MRGRIFTIKKTTILRLSFILNTLFFIISTLLSFLVIKNYDLWFFTFCIFVGLHLIVRSFLFRLDSSCYFGSLLLLIGAFYIYCLLFDILSFYTVFLTVAFSLASYLTAYFCNQNFHYYLSFSLFFVSIGLMLYLINLISIWIFLAIIAVIMILLVCKYLTLK